MDPKDLIVYKCPYPKVRIGKEYDGGYVMAEIPDIKYSMLVSGGIARDISFEEGFLKKYEYVESCVAFDGTISKLPKENPKIQFVKKLIGSEENDNVTNLHEIIKNNDDIFVKMDIEGGEIPWIGSLTEDHMNRFAQIIMEFHKPFTYKEAETFKKLNKNHVLVHFHANNCCGTCVYKNIRFPNIFECTYIHKKYYSSELVLNTDPIPSGIDMKNLKNNPEISMNNWPFVN
jgi:hypothetical protein